MVWIYCTNTCHHFISFPSFSLLFETKESLWLAIKMSFGQTKEDILIRNITATYLVELIPPGLTTIILSTVYQVMCQIKATTKMYPQLLSILIWKWSLKISTENIKQKIIDISSKPKLDFGHIRASIANINLGNFIHLWTPCQRKWNEKILLAKCPMYLLHSTVKIGHDMLTCDFESFTMFLVTFQFLENLQKH